MGSDQQQRLAAIDVTTSCIVQAPAGSGKTELLIQRLLALLAVVDKPQQILAITFTNKAAAEMRQRLLEALDAAATRPRPPSAHAARTWQLAATALERHGDALLRNPAQLNISTIDSFCANLVRKMPWTSRFGGMPAITEDATPLYETAIEQLFYRLGQEDVVGDGLRFLLQHLDNDMAVVQKMLIALLGRRDQWLRHLPAAGNQQLLGELNETLRRICRDQLTRAAALVPPELGARIAACAAFAAQHGDGSSLLTHCSDLGSLPATDVQALPQWLGLCELLLTAEGHIRKTVNKNNGFPAGRPYQDAKSEMLTVLQELREVTGLADQLQLVRQLPDSSYHPRQWQLLQVLLTLLPQLVAELWLVFRRRGTTDFTEIALKAQQALGQADDPSDLLLNIDQQLQHILVDEFQDTSHQQFQLLCTLTAGWEPGDGRTLFLVGDPMQSIYRFREAEVGLFLQAFQGHFGHAQLPLTPLRLRCNFRSRQGIVDWVNATFTSIFPARVDVTTGAVPLFPAEAVHPPGSGAACVFHPFSEVDDQAEAMQVVELVRQAYSDDPDQSVAILVRGRNHLQQILPALRRLQIPYQAQDIDPLASRPVALDLVHLTEALMYRGDRLAWTAVLRAPWCGLTLADLHALLAPEPERVIPEVLQDARRLSTLSTDGQARLQRVWPLLRQALQVRGQRPLRELVESCWLALGGAVGLSAADLVDCRRLLALLEELDQGGDLPDPETLRRRLQRLFAAPDSSPGALQIMTIHKAKGLQFDTVIIPGLGKGARTAEAPLLRWLEHPQYGLLLAPVVERGSPEKDPIYQLVARLEQEKQDHESARLLYVATTRAVRQLHLLGHARANSAGEPQPVKGSLLEKLWPVCADHFQTAAKDSPDQPETRVEPQLYRLPADWSLPETVPLVLPPPEPSAEKDVPDTFADLYSGWEATRQRHVGTLIHHWLERIARTGHGVWTDLENNARQKQLQRSLQALGVGREQLAAAADDVAAAVDRTLKSSRGAWLLAAHEEQAAELQISGQFGGHVVHRVIDRTFVADAVRWVVDYKTSRPAPDEDRQGFLQREGAHYREQLEMYVALMASLHADYPVRGAIYFPMIDGWYELAGEAG